MLLRAGRYETVRPIASGGMATVYLGRVLGGAGFERAVAIKVLHPHVADEPEFVSMFLDEARLAAQIHHPNVVATLDLVDDPLFLVMEYIDGPSLYHLLRACKKHKQPFPLSIALRIFLDTLAGLHAAHELIGPGGQPLNLVHRDVSPQNVLVGSDGISRLTDFGVARAESRITATRGGALKGKLGYMSPEQVRAQPVDRRSDIYAAGAVLWEMLTGDRLFKADNEAAMIGQILAGARQGPRSAAAAVPEALDEACMRALANDPEARYPTAAAFAEAIERAIAVSSGASIASARAVATLVKGLGLNVLGAESQGPASAGAASLAGSGEPGSTSAPLSSSTAGPVSSPGSASSAGVAPAMSLDSVARRSSMGSLADVLEPQSSMTGMGGVVAEPPPRALVGRPALIAVGVAAALAVAVGAILLTGGGQEPSSAEPPTLTGASPETPRAAGQPAPTPATPDTANSGAQTPPAPQPGGATSAISTASATPATAPAPTAPVATAPPRTTSRPPSGPKTPPTSPTTFRPKEL